MARHCISGCGTELKKEDGATDYESLFCSKDCRNEDKRQKVRDQRAAMKKKKRCSACTQPILPAKTWEQIRVIAAEAGIDL
jgi:hypothetical protein